MHSLSILISFLTLASALTINTGSQAAQGHTIYQFPNGTWVENIAVLPDNSLLVTIVTTPSLYLISPTTSQNPVSAATATLIHSFPPFAALLGITSTSPTQFYAIASNLTLSPFNAGLGSYTIFSITLSSYNAHTNTGAIISELTSIPQAGMLNGMSTLSPSRGLLVLADSIKGAIWLLDTKTGRSSILLQEPEMATPSGATLGINGVRVLRQRKNPDLYREEEGEETYIYFSNTGSSTFYRVPFSLKTMQKTGSVEMVLTGYAIDDFALDERTGMAYLAGGAVDEVLKVPLEGGEAGVVFEGSALGAPTSVGISNKGEEGVLYVTTQGGKVVGIQRGC